MTRREITRTLVERVRIEENQVRITYRIDFPLFAGKASKERILHFCWRRQRTALRRPFVSFDTHALLHDPRFQEAADDPQQTFVGHTPEPDAPSRIS